MARCSAGGRTVTNLPDPDQGPGVFAGASQPIWIREISITNTTVTAFAAAIGICSATGTQAGALTEVCEDGASYTPAATAFTSQSTGSTLVGALTRHVSIGAAIGAGYVWTFGENGLYRASGTGNGVIIACPTGTAQHFDFHIVWDE